MVRNKLFKIAMTAAAGGFLAMAQRGALCADTKPDAVSLESLLEEARASNPAIRAAYEAWRSAQEKIASARSWENPLAGVKKKTDSGASGAQSRASDIFTIEQAIPFPGKPSREARMLYHEAEITRQEYRSVSLDIVSQVKIHHQLLAWLEATAGVLKKDADILESIARVAQSRLSAGQGSAEEALILQTQLKSVENAVFEKEQRRLIEEEELNALLARSAGTRWPHFEPASLSALPYTPQELEAMARKESPLYITSRHRIHHARLMKSQAGYGFAPDFKISYEKERFENGMPSETILGGFLSLPLWFWRPVHEFKSAEAHAAQAAAESQSAQNDVFKSIYKEHTEILMHRQIALNYSNEILPLAESALRIAQKNYETGRSDFAKLSEATRHLLEAQMKYYEEVYHYAEHWAMLEAVVGVEIKGAKP